MTWGPGRWKPVWTRPSRRATAAVCYYEVVIVRSSAGDGYCLGYTPGLWCFLMPAEEPPALCRPDLSALFSYRPWNPMLSTPESGVNSVREYGGRCTGPHMHTTLSRRPTDSAESPSPICRSDRNCLSLEAEGKRTCFFFFFFSQPLQPCSPSSADGARHHWPGAASSLRRFSHPRWPKRPHPV